MSEMKCAPAATGALEIKNSSLSLSRDAADGYESGCVPQEGSASLDRFLDALFPTGPGFVELRALRKGGGIAGRAFVSIGKWDQVHKFVHRYRNFNCFFGVASRRDGTFGGLSNCLRLGALFVDIDFKSVSEPQARLLLSKFELPPSIVVASGGGLHCYWLLEACLEFPAAAKWTKDVLRRLAFALRADLTAAEPARVLRIPGTINWKYAPPREVG